MSTPSPFTVTKDGLSYRVEFDVHYLSDDEVETVSRYIAELEAENAELRELVRDVVLLAGLNGCDVTNMQIHIKGGDWRTVWERMEELGVEV